MNDSQAPQPDYEAIAQQAYAFLKRRRAKVEISTFEVLMRVYGYKWGSPELEKLEELDLFEIHYSLLRIIKKDNKYVADSSGHKGEHLGVPYCIPYVFRKKQKRRKRLEQA